MRNLLFLFLRILKFFRHTVMKIRGIKQEDIHSDRVVSGKSWEDFCDHLKTAGAALMSRRRAAATVVRLPPSTPGATVNSTPGSPVDRLLTASLLVAPLVYLLADTLYALRGWDDPAAAVVHVLGAVAYTLLLLRVLTWTGGVLAAVLLVVGALGVAGNVAYGFNTIHVSLGDTDLVDASGAAVLIKPLGLLFPLLLLLAAVVVRQVRGDGAAALVAFGALAWPVAHIANVGWLAVLVNVALVAGFARCRTTSTPVRPADPREVSQVP